MMTLYLKKAIPLSTEKYRKMKMDLYNDPLIYVSNGQVDLSGGDVMLEDGTRVNQSNKKEVTNMQRKLIKKYNNPINLATAIHYPEK